MPEPSAFAKKLAGIANEQFMLFRDQHEHDPVYPNKSRNGTHRSAFHLKVWMSRGQPCLFRGAYKMREPQNSNLNLLWRIPDLFTKPFKTG